MREQPGGDHGGGSVKDLVGLVDHGVNPHFTRIEVGHAWIERSPGGVRLVLDGAVEGLLSDAEINDLHARSRADLLWRPPVRLEVRARFSHPSGQLLGTAGFGFWNNPFHPDGSLAAAPNAVWFFYASPPAVMPFTPGGAPHGWKAAVLDGGQMPEFLIALGNTLLQLPGLNRLLYRLARSTRLKAGEVLLEGVDMTAWHLYAIEWEQKAVSLSVDGQRVLHMPVSPCGPLGFVTWMDNNCVSEQAGGNLAWRHLAVSKRQWMELSAIRISKQEK